MDAGAHRRVPDQPGQLDFSGLVRTYIVHAPAGVSHPVGVVVNLRGGGGTGRGEEALAADYGVDPGRIFASGISNGAFMTNRLACDRADLSAAIAPVSGTLGVNVGCAPSRPVAVLETHGTADPIVPFDGGPMIGRGGPSTIVSAPSMIDRWREIDGCHGVPTEDVLPSVGDGTEVHRFSSTACSGGTAAVFMQVDNGGHTWPCGTQYMPKAIIGRPATPSTPPKPAGSSSPATPNKPGALTPSHSLRRGLQTGAARSAV
jgi:polyhydroxybutyrate depolymerase